MSRVSEAYEGIYLVSAGSTHREHSTTGFWSIRYIVQRAH